MRTAERIQGVAGRVRRRYQGDEDRPLQGYLTVLGAYGGVTAGLAALARVLGKRVPERLDLGDTLLLSVATHKASRLLGMVFAPRLTRMAATVLTAVAASDVLQLGYDGAKQALQQGTE